MSQEAKVKVPKCDGKIIMKVTRRSPKYPVESIDGSSSMVNQAPSGQSAAQGNYGNIDDFFAASTSSGAAAPVNTQSSNVNFF